MSSFNQVILLGNLTRDPQTKQIGSGTTVAEFGIAVNRKFKSASGEQKEEVTFIDCTAFGKQAEVMAKHLAKGRPVFITGRLKLDQWEDKKDGSKRSKLSVVVEQFQFVGGREGGGAAGNTGGKGKGQPFGDEEQFKDEDIPF